MMSKSSLPKSDDRIPGSSDPVAVTRKHSRINDQICRVEVKIGNRYEFGTGILVGSGVVLTCYHVLKTVIEGNVSAQSVVFRFDYHMQEHRPVANTGVEYILRDSDWLIDYATDSPADLPNRQELPAHEELDYALVRIIDHAGFPPLRGYTPLPDAEIPLTNKAKITIIQHPGGSTILETKGRFHGFNGNITRLKHTVPTRNGSSGAPCFDDQFNLIAIHQRKKVAIPVYKITQRLKRNGKYQLISQSAQHSLPSDPISALVYGHNNPMVRKFLEDYNNAPFGGRNKQLEHLNTWLLKPSDQPYLALIEGAGRGKSALLAKWVIQLARNPDHAYDIVYFPISARYNTNLENSIFSALNFRLTRLSETENVESSSLKISDARVLRDTCNELLRHPPAEGRKWLVVLDGLDELAGDLQTFFGLFPASPPPHLRVVVAARSSADTSFKDWLNYLGWSKRQVAYPDLPLLEKDAVLQILQEEGEPLSVLAQRPGMVDRIFELCEGDPLVLRLYIDELISKGEKLLEFSVSDLDGIEPGLDGFFNKWLRDQETIWQESENPLEREDVWALIRLCALAKGRLNNTDLFALAPEHFSTAQKLHKAIGYLRRFLDGDGIKDGYVFNHPRLADYFEKHHMLEAERQAWMQRFLMYGERTIEQLRNGTIQAGQASAYIVRHYGRLLTNQVPVDENKLGALLSKEWLIAWEKLDGTPGGFLDDISRLYPFAQKGGGKRLGQTLHLALCHASVESLSTNISPEVLAQAVAKGALSFPEGLAFARLKSSAEDRIEALLRIFSICPEKEIAHLSNEILSEIETVNDLLRAEALVTLSLRLPSFFSSAIQSISEISDSRDRLRFLIDLIPYLPPELFQTVASIALQSASEISDSGERARALIDLIPHLPPEHFQTAVSSALQSASEISDSGERARALIDLIPHLPPELLQAAASTALQSASEIPDSYERASALADLIPYLPPELFQTALQSASEISDSGERARALIDLIPYLPPELLQTAVSTALQFASEISDSGDRLRFLIALIPHLPPEHFQTAVSTALQSASEISDSYEHASALAGLVPYLPPELFQTVASTALQSVSEISIPDYRARALADLIPHLPPELLQTALQFAIEISDSWDRTTVLTVLAPHLPPELFQTALQYAIEISDSGERARALIDLIPHLPPEILQAAVSTALQSASEISDSGERARALIDLIPHLPPELLQTTLQIASKITDSGDRAGFLIDLIPHLPPELLRAALQIASKISDSWDRTRVLTDLALYLPPELFQTALQSASEISDSGERARALINLIPHLPPELLQITLQSASEISDAGDRLRFLIDLIPHLPPELLQAAVSTALQSASEISDAGDRAGFLIDLIPHLPPEHFQTAVSPALQSASEISDSGERARALTELAPYLPPELFQTALQSASEISDSGERARALAGLVPYLPPELIQTAVSTALQAASEISDSYEHASALAGLVPYLPPELFQTVASTALQSVSEISGNILLTKALVALIPHLSPELILIAAQVASEMPDSFDRVIAMYHLARRLPQDLLSTALQATLKVANENPNTYFRALSLAMLAPRIPQDLLTTVLQAALQVASEISDSWDHTRVLTVLAPHLPPELFQTALQSASEISDSGDRARALAGLVPYLPPELFQTAVSTALQFASEISDSGERAGFLIPLIPHLPSDLFSTALQDALQAASEISYPFNRTLVLAELAPYLSTELSKQLVKEVVILQDSRLTAALAPRWIEYCQAENLDAAKELHNLIWAHRKLKRPEYLKIISAFAPVIHRLGGEQAIRDTVFGIQQTAEWWP